MFKSFIACSSEEQALFYLFIKSFEKSATFISFEEMMNIFQGEEFNHGESLFVFFQGSQIIGSIGIITLDYQVRKEIFMTNVYLLETYIDQFNDLIAYGESYLKPFYPCLVKCGIKNGDFLIPLLMKCGYKLEDQALLLKFTVSTPIDTIKQELTFTAVNKENSSLYQTIHNHAFLNSPNGSTLTEVGIIEMLDKIKTEPNRYRIAYKGKDPVGVYEIHVTEIKGRIETLAIEDGMRKKGYGKQLLKAAIEAIHQQNQQQIDLIVMKTNEVAYQLYLKYGFTNEKILSNWFKKYLTCDIL